MRRIWAMQELEVFCAGFAQGAPCLASCGWLGVVGESFGREAVVVNSACAERIVCVLKP